MEFYTEINLLGNYLRNAVIGHADYDFTAVGATATLESNAVAGTGAIVESGRIYYNSTKDVLRMYVKDKWVTLITNIVTDPLDERLDIAESDIDGLDSRLGTVETSVTNIGMRVTAIENGYSVGKSVRVVCDLSLSSSYLRNGPGELLIEDGSAVIDGVTIESGDEILFINDDSDQSYYPIANIVSVSTVAGKTYVLLEVKNGRPGAVAEAAGQFIIAREGTAHADSAFVCTSDAMDTQYVWEKYAKGTSIEAGEAISVEKLADVNTIRVLYDNSTIVLDGSNRLKVKKTIAAGDAISISDDGTTQTISVEYDDSTIKKDVDGKLYAVEKRFKVNSSITSSSGGHLTGNVAYTSTALASALSAAFITTNNDFLTSATVVASTYKKITGTGLKEVVFDVTFGVSGFSYSIKNTTAGDTYVVHAIIEVP